MRQPACGEPFHGAGKDADAVGVFPAFDTVREQYLVPDTDAEQLTAGVDPVANQIVTADAAQPGHAGRESTHTRHHQRICAGELVGPATQPHLGAGGLQGSAGRMQVSRTVVEHADPGLGHSAPFVLGTPVTRGSGSTAKRNARAKDLNSASTMWCGSRPASRVRWTQMPALKASDSITC